MIVVDPQKSGWSFSLNGLMSEFNSEVSRADSPARRGTVHPLTSQIL